MAATAAAPNSMSVLKERPAPAQSSAGVSLPSDLLALLRDPELVAQLGVAGGLLLTRQHGRVHRLLACVSQLLGQGLLVQSNVKLLQTVWKFAGRKQVRPRTVVQAAFHARCRHGRTQQG